ncbi:Fanconi anemia group I protein [Chlorella vulgaris]
MTEAENLVSVASAYASTSGLDEKAAAATDLRAAVLAWSPREVASAIKVRLNPDLLRAVLTAARPGLTAAGPTTQDGQRLQEVRLVAYKAALALLGTQAAAPLPEASADEHADAAAAAVVTLNERQAADLVCVLDTELAGFTCTSALYEVAEAALDAFESDSCLGCAALDLLPKALSLLQAAGGAVDVPREDGNGAVNCEVSVSDVCRGLIRRVTQHTWPLASIARVIASLRSFPLTKEDLQEAVRQAGLRAKQADAQDLPAVAHQLLMLSSRGCRELILSELMSLFEHKEAAAAGANQRRQLLEVQGAVLLHMDLAVKYDGELGQAWLRRLRGDTAPRLSPFAFAVSFMLAGIQRFKQPVTDALRSAVLGAYKDAAVLSTCPWLPSAGGNLEAASGAGQAAALRAALLQCARNSEHGQGGIVQPMVSLAVSLMKAGSGGGGFGSAAATASKGLAAAAAAAAAAAEAAQGAVPGGGGSGGGSSSSNAGGEGLQCSRGAGSAASPAQRAASLGGRLLLELFEAHKDFRKDILNLCHDRLIGAKVYVMAAAARELSLRAEEVAAPYIRLLALLVRRNQATIWDYQHEMKLSLVHLTFLPPHASLALLLAVWPMCRARREAQDYLAMLLGKARFGRELQCRLLAARGFLYLITQELQSGVAGTDASPAFDPSQAGPSQARTHPAASMSQLSSLTGGGKGGGATLLHEAMSFLRRCLSHQPEVRRAVYDGLPALLAADPSVQESVAEILLPHFLKFYEQDELLVPFSSFLLLLLLLLPDVQGECVRVTEPLPHLLAATRRLLCAAGAGQQAAGGGGAALTTAVGDDGEESATCMLRKCFVSLRSRLAQSTLEDFSIDAGTEYCLSGAAGQLGQAQADVLLGCMEVCMEDMVAELTGGAAAGSKQPQLGSGCSQETGLLSCDDDEEQGVDAEALGADLLHMHTQRCRLLELVAAGSKGGRGNKPEGLTQVMRAAAKPGPGRAAAVAAPASAVQQAAVVPVDKRVPALRHVDLGCLAQMLDAVTNDGFSLQEEPSGQGTMPAAMKLCRDAGFVNFALTATLRRLQEWEASELTAAIATGTVGDEADAAAARELFAVPGAVHTVLLAHCRDRVAGGGGGGAAAKEKKEKDPEAAARLLHQLLTMGASGGLPGVAALLQQLPAPSAAAVSAAELPPAWEGLSDAQRAVVAALPLFHELLESLLKPSCAKELELLCGGLELLAAVVPPPFAAKFAGWAVEGLESVADLKLAAAAKALLQLALRARAAAAGPATAAGGRAGGGSDVPSGERFAAISRRTYTGVLAAAGSHLDSVLSNLEWALSRVRSMAAAARDAGQGQAASRALECTRQAWEGAALLRLRGVAEALVVQCGVEFAGKPCEVLLKHLTRLYKLLGTAATGQLPQRGAGSGTASISGKFADLVAWVNQSCTPVVNDFITAAHWRREEAADEEAGQQENAGADNEEGAAKKIKKRARAAAAASKPKGEAKQVPNLIFQIEQFEKLLIQLSKAAGTHSQLPE